MFEHSKSSGSIGLANRVADDGKRQWRWVQAVERRESSGQRGREDGNEGAFDWRGSV
ncbi:hypothetical protein ACGFY6_29625 [Streptomyces sp. NPDC048387]|uniref:hypothetical protein n=1 Tax=unclassified Streptomyces TaxID=2593676 RepID=UPI0036879BDB